MNNSTNFYSLYFILGIMALILILTGIFLDNILGMFSVSIPDTYLLIAKIAFIISGVADFCLLIYAKKKLS